MRKMPEAGSRIVASVLEMDRGMICTWGKVARSASNAVATEGDFPWRPGSPVKTCDNVAYEAHSTRQVTFVRRAGCALDTSSDVRASTFYVSSIMGACASFRGAFLRLVHAECLEAAGRHEDARTAIAKARERLHVNAAKIQDPSYRANFLENVPENVRTMELSRQWLGDGA